MRLRTHVDPTRATSPTTPNGCILSLAVLMVCAGCGCSGGGGTGSDWGGGSAWNGGTKGTGSSSGSDGGSSSRGSSSSGSGSGGSTGGSSSGGSSGGSGASSSGSGGSSGSKSPFDQFQQHNLDVLNKYRAGMTPLALGQTICTFALAGSQEESQDHSPHKHFIDAANSGALASSGFGSASGENQGDPNGWATADEMTQIDQILAAMYAEGPGIGEAHAHYMNIMSPQYTRLGAGLLEVGGRLYFTNDFSN